MIKIRSEMFVDGLVIHDVIEAAFKRAPHSSHTEHWIIRALKRADALAISLVAEIGHRIVGHVAISAVSITDGSDGWFGLGPVSVLPDYQRQGVGSELVERVLLVLESRGASGCVVLGDPGYYARFGFNVVPNLVFPGAPAEYFQALSYTDEMPQGEVAYHEAFNTKGCWTPS